MNNNLTVFNFESNEVRFVDGLPVANDVAKALGYADPRSTIRDKVSPKNKKLVEFTKVGAGNSNTPLEVQIYVLNEPGIYQLIFSSKLDSAERFQDWVFEEVLPSIRKTGSYSVTQEVKPNLTLPEIADSTLKMSKCINQFENSGDYQLAQLLKSTLGNLILSENQKVLKPVDVEQYEGVIDVAIRLGFNVPSNYEGSLGNFVKKKCGELIVCHNKRYSTSSHKQVMASMYPANSEEVESAVTEYCVSKAFYHRDIKSL